MTYIKFIIALPLCLWSVSTMAMVTEVSGETTCSKVSLIKKQLIKQISCSYEGSSGASMVYFVQQLNFTTANGSSISTVNNATFRFEGEEMLDLVETISIDDQPAEVIKIDSRSFKKLSKKQLESYYNESNPEHSKVLHCFKPVKRSQAFCIPDSVIYNIS